MKRKLLKWGIWLLVILLVCGAVFLMPSGSRVGYGIEKGSVDFTDVEFEKINFNQKSDDKSFTVSMNITCVENIATEKPLSVEEN